MQTFKLTPKPKNDYRLEVKEIKRKCKIEKHGYRHNKIVYGFCDEPLEIIELQSLGLNIEEIPFDASQLNIINYLLERGRIKSKIARLQFENEKKDTKNVEAEVDAQHKLLDLNNNIQSTKEALGITGILKILRF